MPLSTNLTFEMEKLKKQASDVHQKLDGYTYEEVLLAARSRQDSQRYVRQVQRTQIFVQQMTISHELSSKVKKLLLKAERGNQWPEEGGWPCGEAAQWWIKEKVSAAWENHKPETYRQRHWEPSKWCSGRVAESWDDLELGRHMWCDIYRLWKRYFII